MRWVVRYAASKQGEGEVGATTEEAFDAVVVAVGRYTQPRLPTINGMDKWSRRQLHSHSYRVPGSSRGEVVVVVGCHESGKDIAQELRKVVTPVFHLCTYIHPLRHACLNRLNRNIYHAGVRGHASCRKPCCSHQRSYKAQNSFIRLCLEVLLGPLESCNHLHACMHACMQVSYIISYVRIASDRVDAFVVAAMAAIESSYKAAARSLRQIVRECKTARAGCWASFRWRRGL
jgi:hypothetical protein